MSDFTNRIEALLVERHLKNIDLLRGADIPGSTFRSWRGRDACPSAEAALRVARFLDVSVEWLLTGEGPAAMPADQYELLDIYKKLDYRDQNTILAIARGLMAQYSAETGRPATSV